MTKFTPETPVVYRFYGGEEYPATILAVSEGVEKPIVIRVDFGNGDGAELILLYPDGTRDGDDDFPRLLATPDRTSRFVNIHAPDGSQGIFRSSRAECDATARSGRKAVLEVIFEDGIPVRSIIHSIAGARKESN